MAAPLPAMTAHRTWPQRLLIVFNVLCITAAVVSAGVLGYSNKQLSEIARVQLPPGTLRSDANAPPGAPVNYLLVGADTSVGLAANDPVNIGRQSLGDTFRTDTIMVLHIDPRNSTAKLLSFPRDLWVKIPGETSRHRINEAVDNGGGAARLIETITQDFGIPIDHYVQVDFASFESLVNAIGGVPIYFPEPARVRESTNFQAGAGCNVLTGAVALAFVRARKDYQVYENGRWRTDMSGDLGRIARQQFFIEAALRRAFAKGIRNPVILRNLVTIGVAAGVIDTQLKVGDILRLGDRFRNFNPSTLVKYTVPTTEAVEGGADVLLEQVDAAQPILDIFRGTTTATPGGAPTDASLTPANVKLQVQNGGELKGQAGTVTQLFSQLGFPTIIPIDAPAKVQGSTAVVEYPAGGLAKARFVARYISGDVTFEQSDSVTASDVIVVIPTAWQGTLSTPKPQDQVPVPSTIPAPTTTTIPTTTVPATTTTAIGDVPQAPPGVSC